MDPNDRLVQYLLPASWLVAGLCALVLLGWAASLPGRIARRRNHPSRALVSLLGWVSMLIWPLWPIAMVWACKRIVRRSEVKIRVPTSKLHARNLFERGPDLPERASYG